VRSLSFRKLFRERLWEPSRSLNSRSLPIPVVVPLGGAGELPSFRSHHFFPPKQQILFFLPRVRGMSDVAGRNAWLANMVALGAWGGSLGEPAQTDYHHGMAVIANLSLTTSKMMSRWTGNRFILVSMYSWHTIYAWHTCTCIHTNIHTYIHLYIYIHII